MAMYGQGETRGRVGVLGINAAINQACCSIQPTPELDVRYLFQFLCHNYKRIRELAHGGNQANLSGQLIRKIRIGVPPLPEQLWISTVLTTWDRAIDPLEKLIAAKKRLKHGLMQQLLSGKKRFEGFKEQSWRGCSLGDVASESNLRNNGKLSREMLLAVTKAEGMVPMRERVQGEGVERCKIVRKGWFAYNPMRLNIGSIAKWDGPQEAMVSGDYVVFRCHEDKLDPAFLDHYRRSYRWRKYVETAGIGSVRVRIWFSDLGRMKLRLPPIEEQRRIAEFLECCDNEVSILAQELQLLRVQKRGLMQKLLTGKVRVTHLLTEST
jgi:type I restriction enzyme S subunit